jgi:hypothetical protein
MNFLINLCIINGYILYTENSQWHPVNRKRKRYTQLDFRVNLVMQLVNYNVKYEKNKNNNTQLISPMT